MTQKILITTDGTESNRTAVNKALDLAKETGAEITAISVYDTMSKDFAVVGEQLIMSTVVKSYCRRSLLYAEEEAKRRGIDLKTIMAQGIPADVIVGLSGNYDVIICGKTGKRVLHKSVSTEISRSAKCDVRVFV